MNVFFDYLEWFFQKNEFKTELENMEISEINMCFSEFYKTARRKDGSYEKNRAYCRYEQHWIAIFVYHPMTKNFPFGISSLSKRLIKFYIPA